MREGEMIPEQRLYSIVVHGTAFFGEKGQWWRRDPGQEFAFCAALDEQMDLMGVPARTWGHREELELTEFEWSGENDHQARLRAAVQLATYLNDAQSKARRSGIDATFVIIAHSHGGNVALAALRHLDRGVRIAVIHFLGTPFMSYRHVTAEGSRIAPNLYVEPQPFRLPATRAYEAASPNHGAADEVAFLFALLRSLPYVEQRLAALIERYEPSAGQEDASPEVVSSVVYGAVDPVRVQLGSRLSGAARIRNRIAKPIARIAWRAARRRIARAVARTAVARLYESTTGMDARIVPYERLLVHTNFGTTWEPAGSHDGKWRQIHLEDSGTGLPLVQIADFFQEFGQSLPEASQPDIQAMMRRVDRALSDMRFFHSAYYASPSVARAIAFETFDVLTMSPLSALLTPTPANHLTEESDQTDAESDASDL